MGVLTTRLHGSITVIAAMATASVSTELPDKSYLRSVSNTTGQTLLLFSSYAPVASSSFDFDSSYPPCINPTMDFSRTASSLVKPAYMPVFIHTLPANFGTVPLAFAVQSSSMRFHRAMPSTANCDSVLHSRTHYLSPCDVSKFGGNHCNKHHSFILASSCLSLPQRVAVLPLPKCPQRLTQQFCLTYFNAGPSRRPLVHLQKHLDAGASFFSAPRSFRFERVMSFLNGGYTYPPLSASSGLHTWHAPLIEADGCHSGMKGSITQKRTVAVVLLGWLGAEQRHLKKYADWYTKRGIHAVTFVVPMKDLLSLKASERAEKHVDVLTQQLIGWLKEDSKQGQDQLVIFHTFSNTGWLTYGAVLERLIEQGDDFLQKIKGCVVDSAPSARPDPQVWAAGFCAALLRKGSVATQKLVTSNDASNEKAVVQMKPSFKETALLSMLEKFFRVFLQMPYVNRRLNDVVSVLTSQQPDCPQLYIYSSADTVIPANSVEAFIEEQKKAGRVVNACNFECSPHVDHFRTRPEKYSEQLSSFLKLCIPSLGSH